MEKIELLNEEDIIEFLENWRGRELLANWLRTRAEYQDIEDLINLLEKIKEE